MGGFYITRYKDAVKNARPHNSPTAARQQKFKWRTIVALGCALALTTACTPQINRHGHVFSDNEVNQVQPGMSKDQVRLALGTPATTTTVGGGVYYYISSTQETIAFLKPKVTDRRVVAVYFNKDGYVQQVANYGLKDGKVFDFISRETPSHGRDASLLKQLFRNLGQGGMPNAGIDPTQ